MGTGTGLALRSLTLAHAPTSLSGINPSPRMLDVARQHLTTARLLEGAAERLPFDGPAFDSVLCVAVMPYIDALTAMKEWRRVVRAGGQAVFTAHAVDGIRTATLFRQTAEALGVTVSDPNGPTGTVERITSLAAAAGFLVEAVAGRTYTWPTGSDAGQNFDVQLRYFPLSNEVAPETVRSWRAAFIRETLASACEEHRVTLVRLAPVDSSR